MEKKLSDINFFICSTYIDLKGYRAEVIKKIQSQAGIINAQEFFGARDDKPIETCLKEVEQSNVFIMFLAFRFGSIDKDTGKYFIEREYEKAKELKLPKFIYFLDEETPFIRKYIAAGKEADDLNKFKERLKNDHTIETVTTADDLASKVNQNLLKELPNHGFKIGSQKKEQNEKSAIAIIKKFLTIPKVHYGTEIELNVTLGEYERAQENECNAFSFRYGATAKRKFKLSDSKLAHELGEISYLFGDGEKAEELITLPKDEQVTLLLKTIQGTLYWDEPIYEIRDAADFEEYPMSISAWTRTALNAGRPLKTKVQTGSTRRSRLTCGLEFISKQ